MPPYAIVMNGFTASLKTYTARRLANELKIPLIETNRLGRCTNDDGLADDNARDRRYAIATQQAALLVESGLPIVVDGTFGVKRWRDALYIPFAEHDISDVIFVRCVCDDIDIVQARIDERKNRPILPENEAAHIENYLKTKRDDESVYDDCLLSGESLSVVEFSTGPEYTPILRQGNSEIAKVVQEIIWRSFHTGRFNEH